MQAYHDLLRRGIKTMLETGNLGGGTTSYRGYSRDHDIIVPGLPVSGAYHHFARGGLGRRDLDEGEDLGPSERGVDDR